jgi:hypothetical protein
MLVRAFSSPVPLPTNYEGLEPGMIPLSIHFSFTEVQSDEQNELQVFIELANHTLATIVSIYGALLKAANAPPLS